MEEMLYICSWNVIKRNVLIILEPKNYEQNCT